MSGDAAELAERMVSAALSAQGAHKAAGAAPVFTRDSLMSWCLPLAEAMTGVAERMDEVGARIRAMFEADCQRRDEADKAFGMTLRGAREPHQTVPFDPELMRLHAHLGPPAPGPQINGHGAFAPEGGQ